MKNDAPRRWFSVRWQFCSLSFIMASFWLQGCTGLDAGLKAAQGPLDATQKFGNSVASDTGIISPTISQLSALIAAAAGALLTVDKMIEKSRTPAVAEVPVSSPPTTTKG